MPRPPLDLSVYLVTDTALCGGPDGVVTTVRDAVAAGVTVVQLRDPDASEADFIALGRALASELAGTGVPLIVNDRVHLVDVIGADGAHVGQGDLSISEARRILGPDRLLGLSVSSPAQVAAASRIPSSMTDTPCESAPGPIEHGVLDYLGAQSLHATGTKPEAGEVGLDVIAACAAASPWPVVAIGGVKASDAADLRRVGIDGMAVVSAICGQPDVTAATCALVEAWALADLTQREPTPPGAPLTFPTSRAALSDSGEGAEEGSYTAPRPVQEDR